uniref:Group XV phospholipase A2 n=1 Tax=Syphacia muris TaxID=451379 RepID=A0A0N5A8Y2_9BILA
MFRILLFIATLITLSEFGSCRISWKNLKDKTPTSGRPVVLVPGDGGSEIEAKLTGKPYVVHYTCSKFTKEYFDLWLNLENFFPLALDCWADNMKLVYNHSDGTTRNMPGVETRIPGFGTTETVEWLDKSKTSVGRYFTDIVEALVSWGYRRGKDVIGAPFDWRKAPNEHMEYFDKLKATIEELYRNNGNKRVVVIGHSMGNPFMLYFYHKHVTQIWKDKFIEAHVSIAGAWGGAMQIIRLFASGYNMNHYRIILPPSRLREMQRSFTSSAFLFPSYNVWNNTEIIGRTIAKNYTLQNVQEFFNDINYADGYYQYLQTGFLLENLEPPRVRVYCIYGYGIDTPEAFFWKKGYFPDYQPTTTYGDGDGTVNRRSLEACAKWMGNNGAKKVN